MAVSGHIDTEKIHECYMRMKNIVAQYETSRKSVTDLRTRIEDNWVGEGRKEFEIEFNILISKVKDFEDVLKDLYNALVDSEVAYKEADVDLQQDYRAAIE